MVESNDDARAVSSNNLLLIKVGALTQVAHGQVSLSAPVVLASSHQEVDELVVLLRRDP